MRIKKAKIVLPKKDLKRCIIYAKAMPDVVYERYVGRGHHSQKSWIRSQILHGKIGEVASYYFLKKCDFPKISYPDMSWEMHDGKYFDIDLKSKNKLLKYHVKTQNYEMSKQFGISWMFHSRDPVTINPSDMEFLILNTLNVIDNKTYEVTIRHFVCAPLVLECYKPPKKKSLKSKTCLYDEDLRERIG